MKKTYLLLCALALVMTAQARQLTFFIGDQAITPGTTVEFSDVTIEEDAGVQYVTMAPDLALGTDLYMKVTLVAECSSGQNIQMCAGGACATGKTVTKENVAISTGAKLPLAFEYEDEFDSGEQIPEVTTKFSAVCPDYPDTRIEFVLVMGKDLNSLTVIDTPAELAVAPGAIKYTLTTATDFALYDMSGTCMLRTTLSGSGVIATNGLASGVYVYTLGDKSGKIYIK